MNTIPMHTGIRTIRHRTPAQWTALILCAITVLAAAVIIFLRCNDIILLGDDLFYAFMLDDQLVGTQTQVGPRISNLTEAISSQWRQYTGTGGRVPVHILVQLFAGHHPAPYFAIFNALLFAATLILFITYTLPPEYRSRPMLWVAAVLVWFYGFPLSEKLWYEISLSMNYLLPMALVLGWLILWRKKGQGHDGVSRIFLLALTGFFAGWSHESYSLPLSGAIFLYCCMNYRKITWGRWIGAAALWLGCLLLVLAPGNFGRLSQSEPWTLNQLFVIMVWCSRSPLMITVFILPVLLLIIQKLPTLRSWLRQTSIIWTALFINLIFLTFARTGPQAFTSVFLWSYILIFSIIPYLCRRVIPARISNSVSVAAIIMFVLHQSLVLRDNSRVVSHERQLMARYLSTPDSLLIVDDVQPNPLTARYVDSRMAGGFFRAYAFESYNVIFAHNERRVTIVDKVELDEIRNAEKFIADPGNRIPGTGGVHNGNIFLWSNTYPPKSLQVIFRRNPSSLYNRMLSLTDSYDSTATKIIHPIKTITSASGERITSYSKPGHDIIRIDTLPAPQQPQ